MDFIEYLGVGYEGFVQRMAGGGIELPRCLPSRTSKPALQIRPPPHFIDLAAVLTWLKSGAFRDLLTSVTLVNIGGCSTAENPGILGYEIGRTRKAWTRWRAFSAVETLMNIPEFVLTFALTTANC
jgi:hypothetical protein